MARPRRVPRLNVVRAARAALSRIARGGLSFVGRVYDKAGEDDIFFLAGGIAFNVLLAGLPFLLLLVAIFGFVLPRVVDDPEQAAVNYVVSILPPSQRIVTLTRTLVQDVVAGRTQFGLLALALFIWSSTRLFGSLRVVLREIFDLPEDRGVVKGKLYDLQMVLVAGLLFMLNTGTTVVLETARAIGWEWLGLAAREEVRVLERAVGQVLAFSFIFLMFVLIYRYLPARRTPWRVAMVAATFTSVVWELLKGLFAWYVADVAVGYTRTYGALVTPVVLVFWVYYSAVVFVLGGEVAQVYDLYRRRKEQRELLE
jgi:membrane protein